MVICFIALQAAQCVAFVGGSHIIFPSSNNEYFEREGANQYENSLFYIFSDYFRLA